MTVSFPDVYLLCRSVCDRRKKPVACGTFGRCCCGLVWKSGTVREGFEEGATIAVVRSDSSFSKGRWPQCGWIPLSFSFINE